MDFRVTKVQWPPRQRVLQFDGGLEDEEGPGRSPRAVKIPCPVPFQTPIARCTVGPMPGSMAVTMHLLERVALHRELVEFLDTSAAALGFQEPHRTLQRVEGGWALRLTFFDSASAWDEDGAETTQLMGAEACACVCAVSGAWVSRDGGSWGLRVDLRALRRVRGWSEPAALWNFAEDPVESGEEAPRGRQGRAAEAALASEPKAKRARYMFDDDVDDDDN